MENLNKLKVGDWVLKINEMKQYPLGIYKIDKISKDGTKARGESCCLVGNIGNHILEEFPTEAQNYKQMLIDYMNDNNIYYPVLIVQERYSDLKLLNGQPIEDDYDDVINFNFFGCAWQYKAERIKDIPNGAWLGKRYNNDTDINAYYAKSIEDMADYIIKRYNLHTKSNLEKIFSNWLALNGNEQDDISNWKDYWGGYEQLEWAMNNDLGTIDYDEWQATQRIMKHELKWETAREIIKVLYEKEDLSILDCE